MTYTVHLPLHLRLGAAEAGERARAVAQCIRIVERTAPLRPFAYIVHPELERDGSPTADLGPWRESLAASFATLARHAPGPESFCAETLAYPFDWVAEPVLSSGLAVCLDVGHSLRAGLLAGVLGRVASVPRDRCVLTLEVFNARDLDLSLATLERMVQ